MKNIIATLLLISGISTAYATDTLLNVVVHNIYPTSDKPVEFAICASRTGDGGHNCGPWLMTNTAQSIESYAYSIPNDDNYLPSIEFKHDVLVGYDNSCTGMVLVSWCANYDYEMNPAIPNPQDNKTHTFTMTLDGLLSEPGVALENCNFQ